MKALSMTQPWATLVALGKKKIETRSWYTGHRGPLVIHAAKTFPAWAKETAEEEHFRQALDGADLPLGCGLCIVEVIACVRTSQLWKVEKIIGTKPSIEEIRFGDFAPGRYAWLFRLEQVFDKPIARVGSLGLWEWGP